MLYIFWSIFFVITKQANPRSPLFVLNTYTLVFDVCVRTDTIGETISIQNPIIVLSKSEREFLNFWNNPDSWRGGSPTLGDS